MTILVTGGAGFIGSHVCEGILESPRKEKLVIIDDLNDYYDPAAKTRNLEGLKSHGRFIFQKGDICDWSFLGSVFKEHMPERVIHLAARAGVRASLENPALYMQVNIMGTANLLEASRTHSVKTFIFGSSSSVYGLNEVPFLETDSLESIQSPYAATKKVGEVLCKNYHDVFGLNVTCLRFFTVYGPRGRPDMAPRKFMEAMSRGLPIDVYGDGTSKRDYTYVGDIVKGILSALERSYPFEIFNLGNHTPVELSRLIETIEHHVGKKAIIKRRPIQKGDVPITFANIDKAKKMLRYEPVTSLDAGVKSMVSWYQSYLSE